MNATPLDAVIRDAMSAWEVDEDEAIRLERDRASRERAENLTQVKRVITDDDFRRIVADELDSYSWHIVRAFLRASRRPAGSEKPAPRYLWLAGPRGFGKTVAAVAAIAHERGRYITAEKLRRAYAQETREAEDLRAYAEDCRLLVVDDVGTEKNGADAEQARSALYQVVNARQGGRRLTIITGNLDRSQIVRLHDPRTIDRIEHQGAIVDVSAKGRNMRRGGAK